MASFSKDLTTTVLLDTNVLIYSAKKPFDIAHQLRRFGFTNISVPNEVLAELRWLSSKGGSKSKRFATLATQIALGFGTIALGYSTRSVDDQLLMAAKEKGYIVATTDSALRRQLRDEGLSVIYLKRGRLIPETDLLTKSDY
ncbi:MAG: PIN domain-containing protein [Candidatus Methanomethylicaceae archaeon]|jgi:rRNA-processing protein FCF1